MWGVALRLSWGAFGVILVAAWALDLRLVLRFYF
jgi:hypothetical protein